MKKLTKRSQMLLYGCAGIGVNMLNIIVGSYLCSALLTGGFHEHVENWTYLNKNLVVAGIWGALILIAKIVDGVIDIPMSSLTDNLRSKWGRRRPSILIGFIPMVAAYLLFLLPLTPGESVLNTIWFALILCIFYTGYTLTMVTYYATFAEIVETDADRNYISTVKSICDVVYFSISFALVPLMVNGGLNIRAVALIFLPLCLTMLIPMFMIKEESTLNGTDAGGEAKGVNILQSFKQIVKNKDFMYWLLMVAVMNFGLQLFLSGINEFFSTTGVNMTIVMASSFAPVPLTIQLYNRIVKKRGIKTAFQYVMIVFSVAMMLMFVAKPQTYKAEITDSQKLIVEDAGDYALRIKVAPTAEEAQSGQEEYFTTETFTAGEDHVLDLSSLEITHKDTTRTFGEEALGQTITVSPKPAWLTVVALISGIVASFAIGAFFSVAYMVPAELAARANKETGECASSMYFAIQGLAEGIATGIATGPILVAIKTADAAAYIPLVVTVACLLACILAFFMNKQFAKFGKAEK